jgi:hypothetical protein
VPRSSQPARLHRVGAALFACLLAHVTGCDESSLRDAPHRVDADNTPPVCGVTPNEVISMDACGLGAPCLAAHFYGRQTTCGGPLEAGAEDYDVNERCALEHLASGAPGRIPLRWDCDEHAEDAAIYVLTPGVAMLVTRATTPCTEHCLCDSTRSYGPLEECTLREPEFFQGCLEASSDAERIECMKIDNWFEGCAPAEPRCLP